MGESGFPRIVALDAITCAGMGAALIAGSEPAGALLGLSPTLLDTAGWILIPVAALMAFAALQKMRSGVLPFLVVTGNVAWVAASLAVLMLAKPNALGAGFVLAQAIVVAVFAFLEWRAIRTA